MFKISHRKSVTWTKCHMDMSLDQNFIWTKYHVENVPHAVKSSDISDGFMMFYTLFCAH